MSLNLVHVTSYMGVCSCRFLLADLSMINRTVTPWLVVNLHRPIYTSSASGKSYTSVLKVAEDLRLALEDLFFLYQVGCLRFSQCRRLCDNFAAAAHALITHM